MTQDDLNTRQLAEKYSATALVNSLLREWHDFEVESNEIVFKNKYQSLSIVLENFSTVGSHAYTNIFYRTAGREKTSLSFKEFVQELLKLVNKDDRKPVLFLRIMESYKNLTEILSYRRADYEGLLSSKYWSFIDAEQALILGHNFHPCPKSKVQFKNHDHQLFAPEFGGSFSLQWVLLNKKYFIHNNAQYLNDRNWCVNLFVIDHNRHTSNKYVQFPFLPWHY